MPKIIIVEDDAEYATLAHMRGYWTHDSTVCALCAVSTLVNDVRDAVTEIGTATTQDEIDTITARVEAKHGTGNW